MPSGTLLRILDANANRAREALRVLEDYARFALDSRELSADLKAIRHELAGAIEPLLVDAILWRDTPGDVGTANKTDAELQRTDLAQVVVAAGKRLGEALRVIEEAMKVSSVGCRVSGVGEEVSSRQYAEGGKEQSDSVLAQSKIQIPNSKIESLRYRFYAIEQRIARTLRSAALFQHVRLYVLITEKLCRRPWLAAAEQAILGGADCLQLREKDLESGELLSRARRLLELCRRHNVLCIINDRPDIAVLSGADGVHVGQGDLPAIEARKIIGSQLILGVSTHSIDQARQAVLDGADYIGVGPVFPSTTKPREFLPGLDFARQAAAEIPIPAVAIAGIAEANLDQVIQTGIKAVAVTAAVVGCDDIRSAAARLGEKLSTNRTRIEHES